MQITQAAITRARRTLFGDSRGAAPAKNFPTPTRSLVMHVNLPANKSAAPAATGPAAARTPAAS
ncbi:MAG: hypothetical protein ABW005_13040, partial [Burkholderiaceae bacterium]